MDPLRLAIALVPLSAYLLMLGILNMRRAPLLVSGGSDLGALGAALTGWVFIGPIELFRPAMATATMGGYVWLLLLGLYWLAVALAALVSRPRLVVYNITLEELRPAVAEAVAQLDPAARWAGDSLSLPTLRVQLHLEAMPVLRHASLVSSGGVQDLEGWSRLKRALGRSLRSIAVRPNPRGVNFLFFSALLFGLAVFGLCVSPEEVAQRMAELISF